MNTPLPAQEPSMNPAPENNPTPAATPRLTLLGYRLLDLADRLWRKWHRTLDRAALRRRSR
jgi:hypothetical protein